MMVAMLDDVVAVAVDCCCWLLLLMLLLLPPVVWANYFCPAIALVLIVFMLCSVLQIRLSFFNICYAIRFGTRLTFQSSAIETEYDGVRTYIYIECTEMYIVTGSITTESATYTYIVEFYASQDFDGFYVINACDVD